MVVAIKSACTVYAPVGVVIPEVVVEQARLSVGVLPGHTQREAEGPEALRVGLRRGGPERLGHASPTDLVAPVHDDARRVDVIRMDEVIQSPRRAIVVAEGVFARRRAGLRGEEEDALPAVDVIFCVEAPLRRAAWRLDTALLSRGNLK